MKNLWYRGGLKKDLIFFLFIFLIFSDIKKQDMMVHTKFEVDQIIRIRNILSTSFKKVVLRKTCLKFELKFQTAEQSNWYNGISFTLY